ncbi:uncharacterized protein LOC111569491 [Amphiprion ocellaris]|uniref:uncharacterized protein LOC111569491 n=1 Tax=Amphiprion ocellaris TaxID=80972 RepID=UPI000C318D34|nr:uncharacterized protein LOC111569491 [Amphiprion ocellaris]
MESLPVRRRSCLLRLRENCPFRNLRRRTYDVSAAASSQTGPNWNNIRLPATNQPISTIYSPDESEASVDMEESPPPVENQQNQQQNQQNQQHNPDNRDEDCMELDDVDPETGERAQG